MGRRFRVQFETDAENQYFARDNEPGRISLEVNGQPIQPPMPALLNGVATLTLELPAGAELGERLQYSGHLTDNSRFNSIEFSFERRITPQQEGGGPAGRRLPPAQPGLGGRDVPRQLELPPVVSVPKADWPSRGMDRESALVVERGPEGGFEFFVNVDNVHLQWERKANPRNAAALDAQFKYSLALIGLALLRQYDNEPELADGAKSPEERVAEITRALGPVLLPTISGLADVIDDSSPDSAETEPPSSEDDDGDE